MNEREKTRRSLRKGLYIMLGANSLASIMFIAAYILSGYIWMLITVIVLVAATIAFWLYYSKLETKFLSHFDTDNKDIR